MPTSDLVLVTGGSGYIAGFAIAQLLTLGHPVRATIRSLGRADAVRSTIGVIAPVDRLEIVAADLDADAGWARAAEGVRAVLHIASPLPSTSAGDDEALIRPARDGALRVLTAARDAGAARVVMTSSTAAIAYGRGGRTTPFTEADWSDPAGRSDSSAYERSKTIAERAAWDWRKRQGGALELTVINPGAVLGPVLGRDFSASIEIVRKLLDGSLPGLPKFGWPLVDVRDIADLHVRAMTHPAAAGERFIGAGDFTWMRDIAGILRTGLGGPARKIPKSELPDFAVRLSALFDPVVKERLFELSKLRPVSSDKARRVLGWTTRPIPETVLDTARDLIARGLV